MSYFHAKQLCFIIFIRVFESVFLSYTTIFNFFLFFLTASSVSCCSYKTIYSKIISNWSFMSELQWQIESLLIFIVCHNYFFLSISFNCPCSLVMQIYFLIYIKVYFSDYTFKRNFDPTIQRTWVKYESLLHYCMYLNIN